MNCKMAGHIWTADEIQFITDNKDMDRKQLLTMVNNYFNINVTIHALTGKLFAEGLLPSNSGYTKEMVKWLKKNYRLDTKTCQQLTDEFNKKFGTKLTKSSIWHKAYRIANQRKTNEPRKRLNWTQEMIDRCIELCSSYSYMYSAKVMSEEFNYHFTSSMLEHKFNRLGKTKNGNGYNNLDPRIGSVNYFKKGHIPAVYKPVGTETTMKYKDGKTWVHIKIADPNVWVFKHRYIYEQHYGAIPKDGIIIFLDGNRLNFDINNLACISRQENAIINKNKLRSEYPALTQAGIELAQLLLRINEVGKND